MAVYPGAQATYWNYRATAPRRVKPYILAAIHITDNRALMSAMNEAIYSNRVGTGASFTFVNNRNGTTVQCLHPEFQIPFTNGSWRYPNRNLSTVNYSLQHGVGANDSTLVTIENVGYEGNGYGLTAYQIEKCAKIIAYYSTRTGIPITRATVLGHRDYNSVDRMYCPTRYSLNTLLGKIITRANQIKAAGTTTVPNTGTATVTAGGLPTVFTNRTGWKATIIRGKPRRAGGTTTSKNYGNTTRDEGFPIWGEIVGEDMTKYGLPGKRRWFFGPQYVGAQRVVYIPYCDLKNRNF